MISSEKRVGPRPFLEMFWILSSCLENKVISQHPLSTFSLQNQYIRLVIFLGANKHKKVTEAPGLGEGGKPSAAVGSFGARAPVPFGDCYLGILNT